MRTMTKQSFNKVEAALTSRKGHNQACDASSWFVVYINSGNNNTNNTSNNKQTQTVQVGQLPQNISPINDWQRVDTYDKLASIEREIKALEDLVGMLFHVVDGTKSEKRLTSHPARCGIGSMGSSVSKSSCFTNDDDSLTTSAVAKVDVDDVACMNGDTTKVNEHTINSRKGRGRFEVRRADKMDSPTRACGWKGLEHKSLSTKDSDYVEQDKTQCQGMNNMFFVRDSCSSKFNWHTVGMVQV
jgi:hypothetical protein